MNAPQQPAHDDPVISQLRQEARQLYMSAVLGTTPAAHICVRPEDLETAHARGVQAATNVFENSRDPSPDIDQSDQFRRSLIDQYNELCQSNIRNNEDAIEQARRLYRSDMQDFCSNAPCTTNDQLQAFHVVARDKALDLFKSKRTPYIDFYDDQYRSSFHTTINSEYEAIKRKNHDNNKDAIQTAVKAYEATMKAVCAPRLLCLNPEDLKAEHERARGLAVRLFDEDRNTDPQDDDYKASLLQEVTRNFEELELVNEARNSAAVLNAYEDFIIQTQDIPNTASQLYASPTSALPFAGPFFSYAAGSGNTSAHRAAYERLRAAAITQFHSKRRGAPNKDRHYRKLTDLIRRRVYLKTIPIVLNLPIS